MYEYLNYIIRVGIQVRKVYYYLDTTAGMDGETIQPTRISKDEYRKFKQFVQDVHGTTRGHLSTEIENALREYRKPDNSSNELTRIEDDIATLKAHLLSEADGGSVATPPSDDSTHAHADSGTTDNDSNRKPPANAPRTEKVNWLIGEKYDREGGSTSPAAIKKQIRDAYSFGDRTAKKFVQPVINELGAKKHPDNSEVVMWGTAIDEYKKSQEDGDE